MDNRTENHLDQSDDPIQYRGKKIRFHVNDKNKPYLLIVFVLVFAAVATNVFLSSRAASSTNTKIWSTAADWDGGTLSNTIINGNSITLSPVVTAAPATSTTPTSTSTVIANNSSSSITDASNNKWTVTKGIVYENGSKAGYTANVSEVALVGTAIWQENSSNLWWYWTGSTWTGQTSTSPVKTTATTTTAATTAATPTSTVIANNSSSSITDASNNKWTVTKGIVYENGSKAGYTANVSEVALVGTAIWQENSSNLWWYWTGSTWTGQTSTSPVTTSSGSTSTGSTTTTYPSSGTILLDFDATATATWNSLTGTTSTPTGTSVAYQVRTSTNNSTWSAWTSTVSSAAATRYIEIEATLSTTNSAATPSLSQLSLSYTIQATATPAPTVTLSASPTSVTAGQSSTLTWSSTNATSCTASGSWSGTKATSGTTSTGAINSNSTYTLACTGTGGTATQNATVTATAASTGGGSTGTSSSFVPYSSTGSGPTKIEGFAVTGSDFVADPTGELSDMLKLFPSVASLRIAIGTSASNVVPSVNEQSLITAVNDAVQMIPNVQIILDDHESQGAEQTGDTAADLALYTQWGNDFKNNTHVSFNTNNEPGGDSITINSAEAQEYNAIRATGAENRIWLEDGGVFPTDTQNSINSNKMVNIGMDTHFYPGTSSSNASTDYSNDGAIGITDSQGVPLQQAAFEFGPSITGPPSGDLSNSSTYVGQVVNLITSGKLVMGDAWVWSNGGSGSGLEDLIVDQNDNIQQFGTLLQQDGFGQ